jgi:hypothetical protein
LTHHIAIIKGGLLRVKKKRRKREEREKKKEKKEEEKTPRSLHSSYTAAIK